MSAMSVSDASATREGEHEKRQNGGLFAETMGARELWSHPDPSSTRMWAFLKHVNANYSLMLDSYAQLYQWSIENPAAFWEETWHFAGITASKAFDVALPAGPMFPRPDFFSGALLNFAENLLFPTNVEVDDSAVAIVTVTEGTSREMTWAELRELVRRCSASLRAAGTRSGDVVAGYVSNHVEALAVMLAAASIGAVWTGISPDNGVSAVLDRLAQIGPKVLFADNGTLYNGKTWPCTAKTRDITAALRGIGLELVVVIESLEGLGLGLEELRSANIRVEGLAGFLATKDASPPEPLHFEQLPPAHPLYILYSSGTTGLPKAIVHTALGTLIQHKKEHLLHCSMTAKSRLLYYTTTSWMMWHWSVSALAVGASLVLYSGSPFKPEGLLSLPKLLSSLRVTHFGTSAAYLTTLEASQVYPVKDTSLNLDCLEAIYSTAAPLPPSTFSFVYEAFPGRVNLASITGGTDIISLFGAPCPLLPVLVGEIQGPGLGMAIGVIESDSDPEKPLFAPSGEPGDLVCTRPFPCQPLTFFGPGGDSKYREAYFTRFPGMWHHGDFVRMNSSGGLVMLGRSDGVLKPAGVRFGSAEIYNILAKFFAAEVEDSLCVGRRRQTDTDETVCLFVVMAKGKTFDDTLRGKIKGTIRAELSPRHVPGVIDECLGGIPRTGNGKKIEVAVKQILSGMEVKVNASVSNPESLEWFREWCGRNPLRPAEGAL